MLRQRVFVAAVLLPLGLAVLWVGGWVFWFVGQGMLLLAAHEYLKLWEHQGWHPARGASLAGVAALSTALYVWGPDARAWAVLVAWVMLLLAWHVVRYERSGGQEASAFVAALGGVVYLGGLGGLLLALRNLPHGWFWMLLALFTVWSGDSGAYFVGTAWGRHRMSPRVSPKKSWEGFAGHLVLGTLAAGLWTWLAQQWGWAPPAFSPLAGMATGLYLSLLTPLGDLGQSLFKRQAGVKDSGHLLPGHGGVFDRIDSWLWAGPLLYGLVRLLFPGLG